MSDRPEKINLSDVHSRQVDTDLLNELRELFVKAEEQKERYDFTWNGKAKAYFEAAAPTTKTLRAQPEESVNWEKSENLFITGDNLEALKLLQESYLGKIDMIYIDPPYNTGKDFVYQDNFKKTQKENDVSEGILDEDGNRLVKNEKTNGRYHSDWLTMMYPRLKLARNLLSDSGIIFVSIDDNEQVNLKIMMDEIFGEDNFITNFHWNKSQNPPNLSKTVRHKYEYVVTYKKNDPIELVGGEIEGGDSPLYNAGNSVSTLIFPENTVKFNITDGTYNKTDNLNIELITPVTVINGYNSNTFSLKSRFRWTQETLEEQLSGDTRLIIKTTNFAPRYVRNNERTYIPSDHLSMNENGVDTNERGRKEVENLIGKNVFDFPKPTSLVKYLLYITTFFNKDALVLDFFAGSGTTADAVMQLNAEDGGNRNFIVVTLDEETPENSEARKAGYKAIDQISRERIRRAAAKIGDTSGFRALKVDSTGLKEDVFKTAGELDQADLLEDIYNHSDNRSDYDLLYDVLVDSALEYNRPITIDTMNAEQIIKYDYFGELSGVVCYFGENLTDELTRQIATLKPLIAVFKESTFDKSAQKVNVMEQFRIISPDTKVKVI